MTHNPFQDVKDEVIVKLTRTGEEAAKSYIASLSDADLRDAARVHLAMFFAAASLAALDNCAKAIDLLAEVENLEERLDALLEIVRLLSSHHRLQEAEQLLRVIEQLSQQTAERAEFHFLIAVEYERLGLKTPALKTMTQAITAAIDIHNEQFVAGAALWLARWGSQGEPERFIDRLSTGSLKDRTLKQLAEIRRFACT